MLSNWVVCFKSWHWPSFNEAHLRPMLKQSFLIKIANDPTFHADSSNPLPSALNCLVKCHPPYKNSVTERLLAKTLLEFNEKHSKTDNFDGTIIKLVLKCQQRSIFSSRAAFDNKNLISRVRQIQLWLTSNSSLSDTARIPPNYEPIKRIRFDSRKSNKKQLQHITKSPGREWKSGCCADAESPSRGRLNFSSSLWGENKL